MQREFSRRIKRIVVKLGTSVLANKNLEIDISRIKMLVEGICGLVSLGFEVILVSSGAIVSGMSQLGVKCRPQGLSCIQATAACGQVVLMRRYCDLFKEKGINCGQILLTDDDFKNRKRYNNAKNTILALLGYKAVPVINENDTISTEEIKLGDNDKLSALVSCMVGADLLVMLSDVDGLYRVEGGRKIFLEEVFLLTADIANLAKGTDKKQISKGGMKTKLEAIGIATHSGIDCIIANGKTDNVLSDIVSGNPVGTHFLAQTRAIKGRKRWILGSKAKGKVFIDYGAKTAILSKGKSLLSVGIAKCEGNFASGDTVGVFDLLGVEIGKGKVNYSSVELEKEKGKKLSREVIHRDNLVLIKKE